MSVFTDLYQETVRNIIKYGEVSYDDPKGVGTLTADNGSFDGKEITVTYTSFRDVLVRPRGGGPSFYTEAPFMVIFQCEGVTYTAMWNDSLMALAATATEADKSSLTFTV